MRFGAVRKQPSQPHECEYQAAVQRVSTELASAQLSHGQDVVVPARWVLDLLNPRGMWKHIRTSTQPMEKAELPDPDADPLTGCKPATAKPQ